MKIECHGMAWHGRPPYHIQMGLWVFLALFGQALPALRCVSRTSVASPRACCVGLYDSVTFGVESERSRLRLRRSNVPVG
jgi:hypothetical protein